MSSQDEQWLLKEKYNGEKSEAFFSDCKQLALGEPVGYLIGHTPFLDCTIYLDGRPLIPRPETEFWVEHAIKTMREAEALQPHLDTEQSPERISILDLCAGSGCIGVAVARQIPFANVDFAEIDIRLLPTITKNIQANIEDAERCTAHHSNLFDAIPADTKYHFILSNPPYIDPALNRVDDSVRDFEPHLALFGGEHGMEIIETIIHSAKNHLLPHGQLWIEHEPEQINQLAAIASEAGFYVTHHTDQYNVIRYSILVIK